MISTQVKSCRNCFNREFSPNPSFVKDCCALCICDDSNCYFSPMISTQIAGILGECWPTPPPSKTVHSLEQIGGKECLAGGRLLPAPNSHLIYYYTQPIPWRFKSNSLKFWNLLGCPGGWPLAAINYIQPTGFSSRCHVFTSSVAWHKEIQNKENGENFLSIWVWHVLSSCRMLRVFLVRFSKWLQSVKKVL